MRSWKTGSAKGASHSVLRGMISPILAGVLCIPLTIMGAPNQGPQPGVQPGPQQGPQAGYQQQQVPQPGMVNYVEGQASIGGQAINQNLIGSARLNAGQSLATQNGRAEVLLTPGVILRMDGNSAVMMNSPDLADTDLTLQGGRAMVEADAILPANHMAIHEGPATVRLMTKGLYDFDAAKGQFRVFDGRAEVAIGGKTFTVLGGHEFDLNASKLKARGFDKKAAEDSFYRWGSLRSSYLAEANIDAARGFSQGYYGPGYGAGYGYGYAGYYGAGPGWFWDPYFDAYTWLPYDGIFYSPFGWGFYSPAFVYAAPFYGYRGGFHNFSAGYRPPAAFTAHGAIGGGAAAARVGGAGFAGGGFHGGGFAGGGFHGGGFGGGGGRR
jgi:hypothetical protein